MKRWSCLCFVVAMSTWAFAQKSTLDEFVSKNQNELFGKSSYAYLEGQRLKSTKASLAGFNRKVVTIGTLKGVVPISMIRFDDSFSQKPDLYEGLDLRSKVIYLLATLNPEQIRTATTRGIGFGDLNTDQKLVFNSILPKKFVVERREAQEQRAKTTDTFTLTDQQRQKVLLRFSRTVNFELPDKDKKGYYQAGSMSHVGIANSSGFVRVESDLRSGPGELFGIQIRSEVPNKQKPSDLDYGQKALDSMVRFSSPVTIDEALLAIQQTTRVSLFADPRVAKRKLTVAGDVRAGDLLAAIAQMVTGTFRRVGSDYLLTSDLMGLGTRKVKFDQWEADVRNYQNQMSKDWYEQISKGVVLREVKTSPRDPYQPSAQMNEYLSKDFPGRRDIISGSLIDDGIRGIVDRFNHEYSSQPTSTDGIRAENYLSYNFALPSGEEIYEPGGELGPFSIFKGHESRPDLSSQIPVGQKKIADGAQVAMSIRPESSESAKKAVEKAKSLGMSEVWIETEKSEVLQSALSEGKAKAIRIRLVVRPWLNKDGQEESDRTILGDTGASLHEWMPQNKRLHDPREWMEVMRTKLLPEDSVSPDRRPDRWRHLSALTKTQGLVGVVVCDAQPPGYEPKLGEGYSYGASPSDLVGRSFGYSLSMRSAFLRANHVDPIDLVPPGLMSSVNLSPDFFSDMELMGFPRTYGAGDGDEFTISPFVSLWMTFRAKTMSEGMKNFAKNILDGTSIPIWSDLLLGASNKATSKMIPLMAVGQERIFPTDDSGPGTPYGANAFVSDGFRVLIDDQSPEELRTMMRMITNAYPAMGKRVICFDLSRLNEEGVQKFLDQWFEPKS